MQFVTPQGLPPPGGHYSPAVVANGLVFVSGQLPVGPGGPLPADVPFEVQVRQVLANLATILAAANSDLSRVVKVTAYIVDSARWGEFNRLYAEVFADHRPARTVVPVASLHYGYLVEIDAIATQAAP